MTDDSKPIPARSLTKRISDVLIRLLFAGFVGLLIWLLLLPWIVSRHNNPLQDRLPAVGPHVPIPAISAVTLAQGRAAYGREECSKCHVLQDPPDASAPDPNGSGAKSSTTIPDLTHEGQRNASIDWQMDNLAKHHRLFPNSIMPDYIELSPSDLRALASYLASRQ